MPNGYKIPINRLGPGPDMSFRLWQPQEEQLKAEHGCEGVSVKMISPTHQDLGVGSA